MFSSSFAVLNPHAVAVLKTYYCTCLPRFPSSMEAFTSYAESDKILDKRRYIDVPTPNLSAVSKQGRVTRGIFVTFQLSDRPTNDRADR